jgi:small subunit ribosomal protein S1
VETSISKLVSFGAFARLDNGIEGLIHISELSRDRIAKPEEVVHPGDKVVVKIISVDPSTRKIGLSLKQYKQDLEQQDVAEFSGQESRGGVSLGEVAGDELASRVNGMGAEEAEEGSSSEKEQDVSADADDQSLETEQDEESAGEQHLTEEDSEQPKAATSDQ